MKKGDLRVLKYGGADDRIGLFKKAYIEEYIVTSHYGMPMIGFWKGDEYFKNKKDALNNYKNRIIAQVKQ